MRIPQIKVRLIAWCLFFLSPFLSPVVSGQDVLVTIKPLALIVSEIAGDSVAVETIVEGHQDPHSFALKPSDMVKISNAKIVFWVGPPLERFLEKALRNSPNVVLGSVVNSPGSLGNLARQHSTKVCDGPGDYGSCHAMDAHFWLSPQYVRRAMLTVAEQLALIYPLNADLFRARLKQANLRLEQLESELKQRLAPLKNRQFGSAHDAYGPFTAVMGLQQKVAVSVLPEQRLSARRLYEVQKQLKGVSCFLVERGDRSGHRLARVVGVRASETDILAASPHITNIYDFFNELGKTFENCLSYTSVK